jgi:hypothetical protein
MSSEARLQALSQTKLRNFIASLSQDKREALGEFLQTLSEPEFEALRQSSRQIATSTTAGYGKK